MTVVCHRADGVCGYEEKCWVCPIAAPTGVEPMKGELSPEMQKIEEQLRVSLADWVARNPEAGEQPLPPEPPEEPMGVTARKQAKYIAPMFSDGAPPYYFDQTFAKEEHENEMARRKRTIIETGAHPDDPHLDNPNYPYCIKSCCELQVECHSKGSCIWATVASGRGTQEELDLVLLTQGVAEEWRKQVEEPARELWQRMSSSQERKDMAACTGVLDYFPDAILEVGRCSKVAGDKHHPGEKMWWDRPKSSDHPDALVRHLLKRGTIDTDGIQHSAKVAWRALAILQLEIEESRNGKG